MAKRSTAPVTSSASSSVPPGSILYLNPQAILMEGNARYSDSVPQEEAENMRASILSVGRIMEPVGVTALVPPVNGFTHRARYGFRRIAGALLANEGGAGVLVPAILLDETGEQEVLREQVSENVVRKTLSLMDTASSARKMLDAGMSRADVREVFRRPVGTKGGGVQPASNAWLNMVLALLDLPKALQARIHAGDIGLAAAYRLMKAPADKRLAILERAEKESESVREAEEREEKKFSVLETKIKETTEKEARATETIDHETAELEIAEKAVQESQETAAQLYAKEREASAAVQRAKTDEAKKKAKEAVKRAIEARKAAETDAKSAEDRRTAAQKAIDKAKETAEKLAKAAADLRAKLEAAREARAAQPKAKKDGKVSPKAIDKAAKAEGVEGGKKRLTGAEMRKCIEDLSLLTSYPKVAAIGVAIKECFDSTTTEKEMVKKLAAIVGESKPASRK